MQIRFNINAWAPEQRPLNTKWAESLAPGDLVVYRKRAHEVVSTRSLPPEDWSDEVLTRWRDQNCPDQGTWMHRPFVTKVKEPEAEDDTGINLLTVASYSWFVLPEHYSVCGRCGEIPPCSHVFAERRAEEEGERFEELMAIPPGCCMGCGEPITARQRTITFEGENLLRPDLPPGAMFHLRESKGCHYAATRYDRLWAKKTGQPRQMYCPGIRTFHADANKTVDCSNYGACPGDVEHKKNFYHRYDDRWTKAVHRGCWCLAGELAS